LCGFKSLQESREAYRSVYLHYSLVSPAVDWILTFFQILQTVAGEGIINRIVDQHAPKIAETLAQIPRQISNVMYRFPDVQQLMGQNSLKVGFVKMTEDVHMNISVQYLVAEAPF